MAKKFCLLFCQVLTLGFFLALGLPISLGAQAEMILHRGNGAEPESLDPHKGTGVPENAIYNDIFEGLVRLDMQGQPVPGVAVRWDVSPDGTTYLFYLRKDARWSNGDPVTADDFVYSLRRAIDPVTAAEYGPILDVIAGAHDFRLGVNKQASSVGVRALDPLRLEIKLAAPAPFLMGLLAHNIAMPIPQKVVEKFGSQWTRPGNIVVNGPFIPVDWVPQASLTLGRNPHFHEAAQIKLDKVIYYPTENIAEEFKRFRAGELDLTYQIPPEQADLIRTTMASEYKNTPLLGTYFYTINLTRPPLGGDIRLRRALALAIDRRIIVEKVLRRGETPAYSLVPSGIAGYTHAEMAEAQWTQQQREDEARRLYAAAGYGPDKPLSVEILFNTNEEHKRTAIAVGAMWRKVLGVQLQLTNQEWKVYMQSLSQKIYQIGRYAWFADYPDPATYIDLHLSTAGGRNRPGFKNPKYDELFEAAAHSANAQERFGYLRAAEQIVLDHMAVIPLYQYTSKRLVATRVKGWGPNRLDVYPSRYMSVER